MRTARYAIESLCLWCPHCHQTIDHPHSGSEFWTPSELEQHSQQTGDVLTCENCHKDVEVPARFQPKHAPEPAKHGEAAIREQRRRYNVEG